MKDLIKDVKERLKELNDKGIPVHIVADQDLVYVVRCKDCKHRIMNEHYGKKGYLKIKAMCECDTGDPFELGRCAEDDDWFCGDGERKDEEAQP
jgi:hypothetical protein